MVSTCTSQGTVTVRKRMAMMTMMAMERIIITIAVTVLEHEDLHDHAAIITNVLSRFDHEKLVILFCARLSKIVQLNNNDEIYIRKSKVTDSNLELGNVIM